MPPSASRQLRPRAQQPKQTYNLTNHRCSRFYLRQNSRNVRGLGMWLRCLLSLLAPVETTSTFLAEDKAIAAENGVVGAKFSASFHVMFFIPNVQGLFRPE